MADAGQPDWDEVATLRAVVEGTAGHTGEEFFRALVRALSRATGVPNAFVAEFAGSDTRVRTLAYWSGGAIVPNVEWELAGTPCEDVVRGNLCHYPMGVAERFPGDPGVESYLGVPLAAADGTTLGHLAVYDTRPMPAEPRRLYTFRVFAARAAAELERLRMERMLVASEGRYRTLFDEAPVAYVTVDAAGCLVRVNRTAADLLGRPAEALSGTCLVDATPDTPAGRAGMRAALADYLAGRPVEGREVEFARPDGGPVWLALWVRPCPGPDGRPTGGRIVGTDITARVRAEREQARLRAQNQYLRDELKAARNDEEIVGRSPGLVGVLQRVARVAATDSTVLIAGETGTGKELVARAVHAASPRAAKPLVKLNCAALPAGLVESELFGHEKGAFTGADRRRVGRFELADGGTLFLDEVGELPADAQAKLLRVLQEREFERVGGTAPVRVDVRVIAATNRDLGAMVKARAFREDLYYRLNVFPVALPPLRERPDDIPLLAHFFLARFAARMGKRFDGIGRETLALLAAYPWPGNVRELANVVERAVILADGAVLDIDPEVLPVAADESASGGSADRSLRAVEREHILAALRQTGWVIEGAGGAARLLGLHPNTLRSRLKRYDITRPAGE